MAKILSDVSPSLADLYNETKKGLYLRMEHPSTTKQFQFLSDLCKLVDLKIQEFENLEWLSLAQTQEVEAQDQKLLQDFLHSVEILANSSHLFN